MLSFWKGFIADGEDPPQHVIDAHIYKYDGKYGVYRVNDVSESRPRVVFVGGMFSLASGDVNSHQPLKLYKYLEHGHVDPAKIDLYLPVYKENTPLEELDKNIRAYKADPQHFISQDGADLSQALFPKHTIPDLAALDGPAREQAVDALALLASRTTLFTFSYGAVVVECMHNDLLKRMHEQHFTDAEIERVTSALLSHHIAPVNPMVDKGHNLPQVDMVAMNDTMTKKLSNYTDLLDPAQHEGILDKMAYRNTLLVAVSQMPGTFNGGGLHVTEQMKGRPRTFASTLTYGEDGKTIPAAEYFVDLKSKKYKDRHGFDIYTGLTRTVREDYPDRLHTNFVISTYGTNPAAEPFLESLAKGIQASIESAQTQRPRDSAALLKLAQEALTPKVKDELIIRNIRDTVEHRLFERFSLEHKRFIDGEVSGNSFKAWAKRDGQVSKDFMARFDARAAHVGAGESLGDFIKWSSRYTAASGKLPAVQI